MFFFLTRFVVSCSGKISGLYPQHCFNELTNGVSETAATTTKPISITSNSEFFGIYVRLPFRPEFLRIVLYLRDLFWNELCPGFVLDLAFFTFLRKLT